MTRTFVIVGASLAGAKAAETLRKEGFDGGVVLVGEEPDRPYERPPLSKDFLRGEVGPEKVYVHDESFAAALPLERVLGPELGAFYRDLHADHGVDLHPGVGPPGSSWPRRRASRWTTGW